MTSDDIIKLMEDALEGVNLEMAYNMDARGTRVFSQLIASKATLELLLERIAEQTESENDRTH